MEPGDSLTLHWDLTNTSPADAIGWEAYVELPEGGGVVTPELQTIPDVAAGATRGVFYGIVGTAAIQGLLMRLAGGAGSHR